MRVFRMLHVISFVPVIISVILQPDNIRFSEYQLLKHIEAETKWTPFRRRHFQMHFLEWKYVNFDYDFTEVCSQCSN